MYNIHPGNADVYYCKPKMKSLGIQKFTLPVTQCTTRQHFIQLMNDAGDTFADFRTIRAESESVYRVVDTYPSPHLRIQLKIADDLRLYLHQDILKLLGYDELMTDEFDDIDRHEDIPSTHYLIPTKEKFDRYSNRSENFFRNDPNLLFSCSMAKSTHIYGHQKINSMLEIVTANLSRHGEITEYIPQHLAWYPLSQNNFSSAEVTINTRCGDPAPLVYGPVTVELVVRDKETTHNQL